MSARKPADHTSSIFELRVIFKDSHERMTYDKVVVTSEDVSLTVTRMFEEKNIVGIQVSIVTWRRMERLHFHKLKLYHHFDRR